MFCGRTCWRRRSTRTPTSYPTGAGLRSVAGPISFSQRVRACAVWPDLLARDVERDLRPTVSFLMALGIEVTDIAGAARFLA
jgi:hypothetical protein